MTTTETPLQTLKGVKELEKTRGAVAWFKMTREVAGKTGVRLERLADKGHKAKKMVDYKDGLAVLNAWDQDCKDLAKIEGQSISELTRRTTLKHIIPADLMRDLERDSSLKKWETSWAFVLEQVPLRKDWKPSAKKGINVMDVVVVEAAGAEGDESLCRPCEGGGDEDLSTFKGGGKGVFNGYCSWCSKWGHMRPRAAGL